MTSLWSYAKSVPSACAFFAFSIALKISLSTLPEDFLSFFPAAFCKLAMILFCAS